MPFLTSHFSLLTSVRAYLGHPDDESPPRRRVLYGNVALRLGLGLCFSLRGWGAIFAASPDALASRLGDASELGLGSPLAADTALFLLGCTELAAGLLLLAGAFSRVSAVTGFALLLLYLGRGDRDPFVVAAMLAALGGLLVIVLCGSPFMSADRFLDKVEEEERDRAPAVLPAIGTLTPLFPRLGLAAGMAVIGIDVWRRGDAASVGAFVGGAIAVMIALGVATRVAGPVGAGLLMLAAAWGARLDPAWLLAVAGVGVSLLITGGGTASFDAQLGSGLLAKQPGGASVRATGAARLPSGRVGALSERGDRDEDSP